VDCLVLTPEILVHQASREEEARRLLEEASLCEPDDEPREGQVPVVYHEVAEDLETIHQPGEGLLSGLWTLS
jgi:hypothetical protein